MVTSIHENTESLMDVMLSACRGKDKLCYYYCFFVVVVSFCICFLAFRRIAGLISAGGGTGDLRTAILQLSEVISSLKKAFFK